MEEEAATAASMNPKDPRKLDFNAPFLSTRRPTGLELCRANSRGALCDTRNRILFSWEQSPGEPKEMGDCDTPDIPIPPPKPPPGRQTPPKELIRNENNYDGDNDDDSFPDVVDTFSLSAAIDMVKLEERQKHMLGGVSIDPDGSQSPSFIFQRFLLDAEALAILSDLPIFKNINYNREKCMPQTSTPKGCGLEVFFPWRMMKHKPRGVKSPVSVTSMSEKVKPQWGMRKKHKSSLAERSSRRGV